MPSAALKPCAYPGCTSLVKRGFCDVHVRPEIVIRDPERQRLYDRKWQARRRVFLSQHPWCEECLRANIYTPATDVHHKQRHEGDIEKFLSDDLEALCHACHSRKTVQEIQGRRQ